MDSMNCPECGGLVILSDRGEDVCTHCGLVIEKHLSTSVKTLAPSYYRLGKPMPLRKSYYSNILNTMKTLEKVCNILGFTREEVINTKDLYLKLVDRFRREELSVSSLKLAATSIYLSSRLNHRLIKISDISYYFRSLGHRVNVNDIVKTSILVKSFSMINLKIDMKFSILKLLFKSIVNSKEIDDNIKHELYGLILNMIENKDLMRKLQGRSRRVVAATLLYLALKRLENEYGEKYNISIKRVASLIGVSTSALCKSLKRV